MTMLPAALRMRGVYALALAVVLLCVPRLALTQSEAAGKLSATETGLLEEGLIVSAQPPCLSIYPHFCDSFARLSSKPLVSLEIPAQFPALPLSILDELPLWLVTERTEKKALSSSYFVYVSAHYYGVSEERLSRPAPSRMSTGLLFDAAGSVVVPDRRRRFLSDLRQMIGDDDLSPHFYHRW